MALINPQLPIVGQPDATEEPKIGTAFQAVLDLVNGNFEAVNLAPAVVDQAGLTTPSAKRRGKSIIATAETRTNAAYGLMPTPDSVTGIVLPTDGLLHIGFQMLWQESVNGAAKAAIFIGANQLKTQTDGASAPVVQAAVLGVSDTLGNLQANVDRRTFTSGNGLVTYANTITSGAVSYPGDVATGQLVGGDVVTVFAAAGTYDVSVQFLASPAGSVTAKNRKLWVWTTGF